MNNEEIIEVLEARIAELVDKIMSDREELSKSRRMLAIAKEKPEPDEPEPDEPEQYDEDEYESRQNGGGPGSQPGRARTNRKAGPLSRQQSYKLALEIFKKHPRGLDRHQLARMMGYKDSNGTTSQVVQELLAKHEIKYVGKGSNNRERFKYVDDEV